MIPMETRNKKSARIVVNNMAGDSTTYVPDTYTTAPLNGPLMEVNNYGGTHRTVSVGGGRPLKQVYQRPMVVPTYKPQSHGFVNICNNKNVHNSFNTNAVVTHHQPICIDIVDDGDDDEKEKKGAGKLQRPEAPPVRVESDEPCEADNDVDACVVCLERKRKCAAFPCRHMRFCNTCTLILSAKQPLTCPVCNLPATHFEAFF